MVQERLIFSGGNSARIVKVMKSVIRKAKQHKDCVAKEAAEAILNEYESTGKIMIINGMKGAIYEIIMNYGGLFDGHFAQRILKGDFTKTTNQSILNFQEEYLIQREYKQKVTGLKHLVKNLRTISDVDYIGN